MLKKLRNSLFILMIVSLISGCVDQTGSSQTELKIAATSVAITEILEALDVPANQVIGIPSSDSYTVPERYQKATELGTAMSPDMEKLSTLNPSLILSPNSLEGDLADKYKKINIKASFLNLKSVAGMFKSIEELGPIVNKEDKATQLINSFVDYMVSYRNKHKEQTSPRVLILMGLPGSYVVATESSYVGDLVKLSGCTNVYGDGDGTDFININPEDMLKQNPDIILRTSHALPEQVKEMFAKEFKENDIWSQFSAVKNNKVFDLDSQYFGMSAKLNYQESLEKLEDIIYENH